MHLKKAKILVTGAEGFIGSHLVEALLALGCNVRAFVLYNSFNTWGWLDTFDKETLGKIEIFTGDIRDSNRVEEAMKDIDVVFHLAALISIPFSYQSPESFVQTNISGTLNVLQAARKLKTKRVLVTSTSEVYGTAQYVPIDEKHPMSGQSPYSASKIGADRIAESFYHSFDLPLTIVRPFNTYGPRQSARAIIPTIITQLLSGAKEIKLGNLKPTRDLVYVKDTAAGFIRLAESEKTIGEEINIATQQEISMKQLAETIIKIINPEAVIVSVEERLRPGKSEVFRLLGANQKIKQLSGWEPDYTLERGLGETIQWFSKPGNRQSYKPHIYNV
jgi:NAD dependent epimerase/dehydratase